VHTYSGFERKVKNALEERARSRGLEELITEVLVPTEQVEEMIKGSGAFLIEILSRICFSQNGIE
jgi:transcriptional antiterminator NusG